MSQFQSLLSRSKRSLISLGETCSIASLIDLQSTLTAIVK